MSLTLYYHPLSSFCWKTLIALYENETAFTAKLVDLGNESERNQFLKLAPLGQFPVIQDDKANKIISQSTSIIEYLQIHHPGKIQLIPTDLDLAFEVRYWNEFCDNYIHIRMQKIVEDFTRPIEKKDSMGVADARKKITIAYDLLEKRMQSKTWCVGETYTMADCAASPALFYGDKVEPIKETHPSLKKYFERLIERPSFARVLKEAHPYFHMFPYKD